MPILLLNRSRRASSRARHAVPYLALVFIGFRLPCAQAASTTRHNVDVSDFGRVASAQPHAGELLEQGEALLVQGDAKRAAELFELAGNEAPQSSLIARRHCQALTDLGERDRALAACRRAMQWEGSPLDIRSLVRAMMSNPNNPTFEELHQATLLATRGMRAMSHQPWGYAAMCDIARRLHDIAMLDACRKELKRVAPDHAETRRALATMISTPSPLVSTLGCAGIVLAVLATLFDALRRHFLRTVAPDGNHPPELQP
jgi:tetratricopeptide (TPR) repeat protein